MAFKDLFKPKWEHSNWKVRQRSYYRHTQALLAEISKRDADDNTRLSAFQKLPNDNALCHYVLSSEVVVDLEDALPLLASWMKSRPPVNENIVNTPLQNAASDWHMPIVKASSQEVLDILGKCFAKDHSVKGVSTVEIKTQADVDWLKLKQTAKIFYLGELYGRYYPLTIGDSQVLAPSMICLTIYGDHIIAKTGSDSYLMLVHYGGITRRSEV